MLKFIPFKTLLGSGMVNAIVVIDVSKGDVIIVSVSKIIGAGKWVLLF